MLLMFLLCINEQPGQGTLAKKATKWESHQYQSELCTLKVWMMLGERSFFCIRGAPGIPLMLMFVSILASLDFQTSQLTSLCWWGQHLGVVPEVWGDLLWSRKDQHTHGIGSGALTIYVCFHSASTHFTLKWKHIVSDPHLPSFSSGGIFFQNSWLLF